MSKRSNREVEGAVQGEAPRKATKISNPLAIYNQRVIRKLTRALDENPQANLLDVIPASYARRFQEESEVNEGEEKTDNIEPCPQGIETCMGPIQIQYPLSDPILLILENVAPGGSLPESIPRLLKVAEPIWTSPFHSDHKVLRIEDVAIKVVQYHDLTEYKIMCYLERECPQIPAPRPFGLVTSGKTTFIFMSYVQGISLQRAWSNLSESQKKSISDQLDEVLHVLRHIRPAKGKALGGVDGEGCRDTRRHTRCSTTPIHDDAAFTHFVYERAFSRNTAYMTLLRELVSSKPSRNCFTHGDLLPSNIIVQPNGNEDFKISGIVDWEMSGFYPEYWECIKATNTLSPSDKDDWYSFLPACTSPLTYSNTWLLDTLLDVHVS